MWYDKAIKFAQEFELMNGDEQGFRPNDYIKRSEMAQLIYNLINLDENVIKKCLPSTVTIKCISDKGTMQGAGAFLFENVIVTAKHVIEGATDIEIILYDGTSLKGEIYAKSTFQDIAYVKVDYKGIPLPIAKNVIIGEEVIAIGNPLGLQFSSSKGIITAERNIGNTNYYQTDCPINHGNSGGAFVNLKGEIIGITTSKLTENNAEGLGFITPSPYFIKRR